jgi:hypothetical protein
MNTVKALALGFAALFVSGSSFGQATVMYTPANPSARDNPGVLGTSYVDLGASLERVEHLPDAAYNAMISANQPITPGVDARLGYDYWWYNYRGVNSHYHLVTADSRIYRNINRTKPYIGLMVGYQWSRDYYAGYTSAPPAAATPPSASATTPAASPTTPATTTTPTPPAAITTSTPYGTTTTYTTSAFTYVTTNEHRNLPVWGLSAGVELPVGRVAFTPHVEYFDPMVGHSKWSYRYGLEAHHWFTETMGGYADVTYNDVQRDPNAWVYLVGVRYKF